MEERLQTMLDEVRIDAEIGVPATADDATVGDMSADAAVVYLPLRLSRGAPRCPLVKDLAGLLKLLPHTALVLAAEDIELDAEPEAGHD